MKLFRTVYVSRATAAPDYAALSGLLTAAQDRNERDGITGLLCYSAPFFLQAVEGPHDAVSRLLARLYRDPRHTDLTVVAAGPVGGREFPEWAMALARPHDVPPDLFPSGPGAAGGAAPDVVLGVLRRLSAALRPAAAARPPTTSPPRPASALP